MHGSWCSESSGNHWKRHEVLAFIKLDSPQEYPACVMQIQVATLTKFDEVFVMCRSINNGSGF